MASFFMPALSDQRTWWKCGNRFQSFSVWIIHRRVQLFRQRTGARSHVHVYNADVTIGFGDIEWRSGTLLGRAVPAVSPY
jgi:hypothetical protein